MDFESILRTIQPFLVLFIALFAAFLTATWVSAVIWTFRDIRSRTRDIFAQILATLMVLIFFPLFPIPGLILYMLLRPRETLAEIYERTLEEEALLQGIEERLACPGCNRSIEEDFIVCPTCHTRLKKPCIACGRRMHLRWSICPYCGTSQSQTVPPPPEAIILPPGQPIESPRLAQPVTASEVEMAELEFEPESDIEFGTEPLSTDATIEPAEQAEQHMDAAWETETEAYSDSDQGEEQPPPVEQETDLTAGDEHEAGQYPEPEPDEEAELSMDPDADPSTAGQPDLESEPQPDSDTEHTEAPESGVEPPPAAEHDDLEQESEPGSESSAEEEADSEQDGESAQPELL